jgi:hypothetical protein
MSHIFAKTLRNKKAPTGKPDGLPAGAFAKAGAVHTTDFVSAYLFRLLSVHFL